MENQIEIVKAIADSMEGIGGVPTNVDFYEEFNFRLKAELKIPFDVGQSEQLKAFLLFIQENAPNYRAKQLKPDQVIKEYLESL